MSQSAVQAPRAGFEEAPVPSCPKKIAIAEPDTATTNLEAGPSGWRCPHVAHRNSTQVAGARRALLAAGQAAKMFRKVSQKYSHTAPTAPECPPIYALTFSAAALSTELSHSVWFQDHKLCSSTSSSNRYASGN